MIFLDIQAQALHRELYFVLPVLRKNAYNYNLKNKFKEGGILKMKKILTVLLALSVVFTYTVGTAFALPSDGTSQAGLTAAKEEFKTPRFNRGVFYRR